MTDILKLDVSLGLPKWAKALTKSGYRFKVMHGGRGQGAKSWTVARMLLMIGVRESVRTLCARETMQSMKESVHQELSNQIKLLGLDKFYRISRDEITGINGTKFAFTGLRVDPDHMKSFTGFKYCWVEEAHNVSVKSWDTLTPTIFRNPGSEIWVTFNPRYATDPTSKMFLLNPPEDALVLKMTHADNPHFSDEMRRDMERCRRINPDAYEHIWNGGYQRTSDAQIFGPIRMKDGTMVPKYTVESFEVPYINERTGKRWDANSRPDDRRVAAWYGPYFGADWGFSVDPVTLVKCWITPDQRGLYIEYEAFGHQVETPDIPELFDTVPEWRNHTIRGDCARPEVISQIANMGFDVVPCDKWPKCVEDGISFIRSFERIVIHERCKHVQEEFIYYSYKVDALSGDVLPIVVSKNDHTIDALRYALEPVLRKSVEEVVVVSEYDTTPHRTVSDLDLFDMKIDAIQ